MWANEQMGLGSRAASSLSNLAASGLNLSLSALDATYAEPTAEQVKAFNPTQQRCYRRIQYLLWPGHYVPEFGGPSPEVYDAWMANLVAGDQHSLRTFRSAVQAFCKRATRHGSRPELQDVSDVRRRFLSSRTVITDPFRLSSGDVNRTHCSTPKPTSRSLPRPCLPKRLISTTGVSTCSREWARRQSRCGPGVVSAKVELPAQQAP